MNNSSAALPTRRRSLLMVALYHLPQLAGAVLLLALVWWTLATVLVLTYPESVGYWGRWRRWAWAC